MSSPITKIGLPTAIAIVVANMIGTGVFGSLGFQVAGVMSDVPTGFPIMMLWLIGGVVSFCGAVCYAELASMFPRSGGEYHLLSEAWRPWVGFLSGWLSITVGFAAPVAANASLLGIYLGDIFDLPPLAFALPVVLIVSVIHLGKTTNIARFQSSFTYGKVLLILVIGLLGFIIGKAQPISFLPQAGDMALIQSTGFATSLIYVMYAYTGWNAATYMMDEVRNPTRIVPLALLIGTAAVTVIYMFINAAFLYSTPVADMAGKPQVGLIAAKAILGENGGMVMGILISFGLISTISSMTWAGPRVTSAMGRDHSAFSLMAKTNHNGVPLLAILLQTVLVIVMVCTASFDQLLNYVQALLTISSLMVVAGVVWLRIRQPGLARPYRAWAYPLTPIVFAGVSLYMLWFQIQERKTESLVGLATLAIGLLVYWYARRRGTSLPTQTTENS